MLWQPLPINHSHGAKVGRLQAEETSSLPCIPWIWCPRARLWRPQGLAWSTRGRRGGGRGDELIPSFSQTALIVKPQTLSKWPQVCARQFRWDTRQEWQEADLVSVERPSSPLAWPGPVVPPPPPHSFFFLERPVLYQGPEKQGSSQRCPRTSRFFRERKATKQNNNKTVLPRKPGSKS